MKFSGDLQAPQVNALWQRRAELRQRWARLLLVALAGGTAAATSAVGLG